MPVTETLFRVDFHTKKKGLKMFLLVWGLDALDATGKITGLFEPNSEYALDGISPQTKDGERIQRPAMGGCFVGRV